ncbi:hypothetical protein QL285_036608 [Trifolium repens]|nr:hypothetical protein QL285_036608 [Trifolium repens]
MRNMSAACCLLNPHQGTPASCNIIIFKAISNNLHLAFKMMAMPTSHQPPCRSTCLHHILFEPRNAFRPLEETLGFDYPWNFGIALQDSPTLEETLASNCPWNFRTIIQAPPYPLQSPDCSCPFS